MWFIGIGTGYVGNGTRQGMFVAELCTSMFTCLGNTVKLAWIGRTKHVKNPSNFGVILSYEW